MTILTAQSFDISYKGQKGRKMNYIPKLINTIEVLIKKVFKGEMTGTSAVWTILLFLLSITANEFIIFNLWRDSIRWLSTDDARYRPWSFVGFGKLVWFSSCFYMFPRNGFENSLCLRHPISISLTCELIKMVRSQGIVSAKTQT